MLLCACDARVSRVRCGKVPTGEEEGVVEVLLHVQVLSRLRVRTCVCVCVCVCVCAWMSVSVNECECLRAVDIADVERFATQHGLARAKDKFT